MSDLIESQFRHNTEVLLLNSLVLRKKGSSFEVCTIPLQIMFRVRMAPKKGRANLLCSKSKPPVTMLKKTSIVNKSPL